MAIVLIVEDGTGLPNANTYVSVETVRAYAEARGVALGDDGDIAAMIVLATDYLETFECDYVGRRTTLEQALCWPRTDVEGNCGFPILTNVIPRQLISAQCQAVISQHNGVVLQPDYSASSFVTEETIGPITTKYADPLSVGMRPTLTAVDAFLAPLFGKCVTGSMLTTVRV